MRRPISIAMAISVGVHAAFLSVAGYFIHQAHSSDEPDVPLIIVLPSKSEAPAEQSQVTEPPATLPPQPAEVDTATVPQSSEAPEHREGQRQPAAFEASSAFAAIAEESTPGITQLPLEIVEPKKALRAAVTTTSTATARAAPLTPKQEKMFARKILDWAENYDKREDEEDELTWEFKGQQYKASFTAVSGDDETSLDRLLIRVSTQQDGETLSTEMQMKRLAFSNYAQFVNRWDKSVQLHNDEMDGRFHSNSAINLSYNRKVRPQFHGKVTTAAHRINVTESRGYVSRDEIFLGGVQTGVRSIRLPKNFVPLANTAEIRDGQVHEFQEDTRITFLPDGSYRWISLDGDAVEQLGTIAGPAYFLVGRDKAKLYVKGTVEGKVLVYSNERIVIEGDLTYARDPQQAPDSDDYIGLVSAKSIEIADSDVTGPGDLQIDAAIYAKRRFAIRDFRSRERATLNIFGSLTAGTLTASEPRYATRIRFDPRLESRRPPGFPVTDRYELESWDRAWTAEPGESL